MKNFKLIELANKWLFWHARQVRIIGIHIISTNGSR